MKNDIFYMINQVETNPDHYDIKELSQNEKDEYTERILHKLKERNTQNQSEVNLKSLQKVRLKKFLGAAVIFLICLLSIGGVAYAMTDGFRAVLTFISGGAIYETEESVTILGEVKSSTAVEVGGDTESGVPLLLEEDRLYFTGDGGNTDITDLISETEPYFIDVIDAEGNTHKFVLGGRAEEEYFGYVEFIIDSEGEMRGGAGAFGSQVQHTPEWLKKGEDTIYSEVLGKSVRLWSDEEAVED